MQGKAPSANGTVIGYVPQVINHNLNFPASAMDVVLMGKYDPARRSLFRNKGQERKEALDALAQGRVIRRLFRA